LREPELHLPKYVFTPNRHVRDEEELLPARVLRQAGQGKPQYASSPNGAAKSA